MKKLLALLVVTLGAGSLTSCYYDPYGASVSGVWAGGGTTFIQTSNSRWLYDPVVRCYFDRNRGAFYDPWLGGFYPTGFCPQPIRNVPHPYGWNGRGVCPVPRNVRFGQISNYQNRVSLIRARNYSWANNVAINQSRSNANWSHNRVQAASNFRQPSTRSQQRFGPTTQPAIPRPQSTSRIRVTSPIQESGIARRASFNRPVATPTPAQRRMPQISTPRPSSRPSGISRPSSGISRPSGIGRSAAPSRPTGGVSRPAAPSRPTGGGSAGRPAGRPSEGGGARRQQLGR